MAGTDLLFQPANISVPTAFGTFTIKQLPRYTAAVVQWIQQQALPVGSRVAVSLPNSEAAFTLLIALPLAGHVPVAINPALPREQQLLFGKKCEISAWVHSASTETNEIEGNSNSSTTPIRRLACPDFSALLFDNTEAPLPSTIHNSEQEALIIATSGSSGDAKGVRLSWRALMCSAHDSCRFYHCTTTSRWACPLPWHHAGGAMILWRSLVSGCGMRWWSQFHIDNPAHNFMECSHLSIVPTMLRRLLAQNSKGCTESRREALQDLAAIVVGGAACDSHLRTQAAGLPVSYSYGLSESAGVVTGTNPSAAETPPIAAPPLKGCICASQKMAVFTFLVATFFWLRW